MESMDENDRQEGATAVEEEGASAQDKAVKDNDEYGYDEMVSLYDETMRHLKEGQIVSGRVIGVTGNHVIVDVGYKSEGLIPLAEFTDHDGNLKVEPGDEVEVLLERTEDSEGYILLSKVKAERMKVWSEIEQSYKAGDVIHGRVIDRIKGGLTVDIGIRAFLPGSLVDIKPVKNLDSLRGEDLEFKVISMDRRRNNVVLSRKAVLEREFEAKKADTLERLEEGAVLDGVVKNITDYGVFVDLGGIDGLLHITDISWGRVNHPSEHFSVGDEIEVVVLRFDPDTERVSLGYKQRSEDPWSVVDKKYPLGSRVRGKVVSLVDYGAFVELEEGVEGLIHVSEMSWTKKIVNPAKILEVGDEVDAIVSELDLSQRRISLSLRQAERNPWEELAITHPVGSVIEGKVRNLTEFGAFVQITDEIDGLIHVSDMSWTKRVKHPSDVLKKGDDIQARITNIDVENQRVSLSIKEFLPNEWESFVAEHKVGDTVTGRVVNVTDFGLFVDIYEGLEGLAHVSEIETSGEGLEDKYSLGDWVSARILRIEEDDKKVGLTMRGVAQPSEDEVAELEAAHQKAEQAAAEVERAAAEAEAAETGTAAASEPPTEESELEGSSTDDEETAVSAPAVTDAAGEAAEDDESEGPESKPNVVAEGAAEEGVSGKEVAEEAPRAELAEDATVKSEESKKVLTEHVGDIEPESSDTPETGSVAAAGTTEPDGEDKVD